jgi:pimeloyl-ACP methyl ester carboxylesterase
LIRGTKLKIRYLWTFRQNKDVTAMEIEDYGVTEPARLGQTLLPDGRRLGWAEWGPANGAVVLLCPGAATSRWLGFGGGILDEAAIRLISVDRPGLGSSDPDPARTLTSWATDIKHFASTRTLHPLTVVGFSQGAPFALACAAAGIVTAAAVVSGTDELAHPQFAHAVHPQMRAMVDAVHADPDRAMGSFAGLANPDALAKLIITVSPETDRAVYTAPIFQRAWRRAMQEALAQGPAGYARDTVLTMSRWPFDPANICVPVDLWYGQHDSSPGHSPDLGSFLAQRIRTAHRHVVPHAAGALLWTHTDAILGCLLGHRSTP